jgi:hypothetical protein
MSAAASAVKVMERAFGTRHQRNLLMSETAVSARRYCLVATPRYHCCSGWKPDVEELLSRRLVCAHGYRSIEGRSGAWEGFIRFPMCS